MAENKEIILDNSQESKIENKRADLGMTDIEEDRKATVPREVESWMKKIESDPTISNNKTNQVKGDDDSILKPIAPVVGQIILPTNKITFTGGFSKAISDAGRWLSEFILRIIKKSDGNVKFKEE